MKLVVECQHKKGCGNSAILEYDPSTLPSRKKKGRRYENKSFPEFCPFCGKPGLYWGTSCPNCGHDLHIHKDDISAEPGYACEECGCYLTYKEVISLP